jgi:hypothetical protein
MPTYSIYKPLNLTTDKYTNTNKVTTGLFGGDGTLSCAGMATASTSASNKEYYYTITHHSGSSGIKYFDVAYGHYAGSGSVVSAYQYASEAVYKQFANILLDDPYKKFTFSDVSGSDSGTEREDIYIMSVKTAKMKDRVNTKWTMTLTGSVGTAAAPTGRTLHLTNYTGSKYPSIAGEYFPVISGSAGVPHSSTTLDWSGNQNTTYGHFYPNHGLVVLAATKMSASIPGGDGFAESGSSCGYGDAGAGANAGCGMNPSLLATADNAGKFATCLIGSASNGEGGGSITMRTEQDLNQSTYYCRLFNQEYNFSSNPTFLKTGSDLGDIRDDLVGDPTVYISGLGLYNAHNELIAVAKVNEPVKKNFGNEQNFVVKIDG